MPRTAGKPNPIFDDLKTKSDHLTNAKAALEKSPNDAKLKKNVETLQADFSKANDTAKRHRFINTTGKRAKNVISTLGFLKRSFDKKQYDYKPEEATEILAAIDDELTLLKSHVKAAMEGKSETKGQRKAFSFE